MAECHGIVQALVGAQVGHVHTTGQRLLLLRCGAVCVHYSLQQQRLLLYMPVGIRESSTGGERGGSCVSGQPLCSAARWRWETSQTSHSWTRNIKRTRTIENSPSADRKIVSATCQPACGLREASNKRSRLWTNGRAASQAPSIATTPARSRSLRVCHHQNQLMSLSRLVQTNVEPGVEV